jgi:hypothetical protein
MPAKPNLKIDTETQNAITQTNLTKRFIELDK